LITRETLITTRIQRTMKDQWISTKASKREQMRYQFHIRSLAILVSPQMQSLTLLPVGVPRIFSVSVRQQEREEESGMLIGTKINPMVR